MSKKQYGLNVVFVDGTKDTLWWEERDKWLRDRIYDQFVGQSHIKSLKKIEKTV